MSVVDQLIAQYNLRPHPEGGWYRQTYKSVELVIGDALPERFGGSRTFSTAIYFLLEQGNFSAFHRIKSDECWHFYAGGPLHVFVIDQNGILKTILLGNDFERGQTFQYIVPANCWFASRPAPGSAYSFVGCTVSPGFEFEDFDLAKPDILSKMYPQHIKVITELCR
jgi:predicted cupin superfamily sugar epimerase